jgi:hypothetical protein
MRVDHRSWTSTAGWSEPLAGSDAAVAQLVLVFGSAELLRDSGHLAQLRAWYPEALITGCSTAGEILGTTVADDTLAVTAVVFEQSTIGWVCVPLAASTQSASAAQEIVRVLDRPDLRHVIVLCDGLSVNGDQFAQALREQLPPGVSATGGLAGDADRFQQTLVCCNGPGVNGQVVAIGLYGAGLRIGFGSLGGWDSFGPARRITHSIGNVLHELDGQPALNLYKTYLGDHASGLPGSALLFPLLLEGGPGKQGLVRTVLAVDESSGSMTFAGDMPEGRQARLMKANFDRLIDGASGAALAARQGLGGVPAQLALLISCVGRKLVLRQRIEEEVESVREVLGAQAALTGFYSYGEICPQDLTGGCELHNQTMTITTFAES